MIVVAAQSQVMTKPVDNRLPIGNRDLVGRAVGGDIDEQLIVVSGLDGKASGRDGELVPLGRWRVWVLYDERHKSLGWH